MGASQCQTRRAKSILAQEYEHGLDKLSYYEKFQARTDKIKDEFLNFCPDVPSVLVVPINSKAFILIGGWSTKCFTKSDEKWINNWSKKINNIFSKNNI